MANTRLTVKTDVGTFTRTTARIYTHIVVARDLSEARIRRDAAAELAQAKKQETEYKAVVAGGPTGYESQRSEFPRYLANVQEQIRTSDERLNARLVRAAESKYSIMGWSGRLDLAMKVAQDARTTEYDDVRIYALDGTRVV